MTVNKIRTQNFRLFSMFNRYSCTRDRNKFSDLDTESFQIFIWLIIKNRVLVCAQRNFPKYFETIIVSHVLNYSTVYA